MGCKEIHLNFNVSYFLLLLFNICIFESDQVNPPNVGALESTEPNISGVEILEGNIIDKRFIDEESSKIVSIITKEMIPQLFERFQHPKLTFTKETWKPKNCEINKYWSIQLIFDKRRDVEPPDTVTLTMMLDDVFRIYRNISRVEYDFSKAIFERESVKIMICFQNVPETANKSTQTNFVDGTPSEGKPINSEYKCSTSSSADKYITTDVPTTENKVYYYIEPEQEYVKKLINSEILPNIEAFGSECTIYFEITHKGNEFGINCPIEIFDISFDVHGRYFNPRLIEYLDKRLATLPDRYECYTYLLAACLLESGETTSKNLFITIRFKVSKMKDTCKISKGGKKIRCI